jgi:hypothetical protein
MSAWRNGAELGDGGMQWTHALNEEFEELMEDYQFLVPALERAVQTDDRLERIERRLAELETGERNVE